MNYCISLLLVFLGSSVFAGWDEDFQRLRKKPRSYQDSGAICEEIARLRFEEFFNNSNYEIVVGIAYADRDQTLGELDVVVFDRSKGRVVQVSEVKCWRNLNGGLRKAHEQRTRFLSNLHRSIFFVSTSTRQEYLKEQFVNIQSFTTVGQKGSRQAGYDFELDYDLEEFHQMTQQMIACQKKNHCARP